MSISVIIQLRDNPVKIQILGGKTHGNRNYDLCKKASDAGR